MSDTSLEEKQSKAFRLELPKVIFHTLLGGLAYFMLTALVRVSAIADRSVEINLLATLLFQLVVYYVWNTSFDPVVYANELVYGLFAWLLSACGVYWPVNMKQRMFGEVDKYTGEVTKANTLSAKHQLGLYLVGLISLSVSAAAAFGLLYTIFGSAYLIIVQITRHDLKSTVLGVAIVQVANYAAQEALNRWNAVDQFRDYQNVPFQVYDENYANSKRVNPAIRDLIIRPALTKMGIFIALQAGVEWSMFYFTGSSGNIYAQLFTSWMTNDPGSNLILFYVSLVTLLAPTVAKLIMSTVQWIENNTTKESITN